MTAEDFCDFFEVGIGVLFYIVGEVFGDDFLVDRTEEFRFHVAGRLVTLSSVND